MAQRNKRRKGKTSNKGGRKSRMFHRGDEGRDRVDDELARQKEKREAAQKKAGQPLRFFVPVGETKEYVILDDKPDFFMYEHNMKDPNTGKWGFNTPCIKEWDNCPVCEEIGDSTYIMFLSVLDLTPFTDRKDVRHEFSRKLMAVKPSQQKKFIRAHAREGTLRGAIFEASRDGQKDAAIGNDIEFVEFMDEAELAEDYVREWEDREGKSHTENCGEPIEYEELFEEPTMEELCALMGTEPTPGSKAQTDRDLDEGGNEDDWDEEGDKDEGAWDEEEEKPQRGSRRSRRSTARKGREEEEESDEKPARRSRSSRRSRATKEERPSRSSRRSRR